MPESFFSSTPSPAVTVSSVSTGGTFTSVSTGGTFSSARSTVITGGTFNCVYPDGTNITINESHINSNYHVFTPESIHGISEIPETTGAPEIEKGSEIEEDGRIEGIDDAEDDGPAEIEGETEEFDDAEDDNRRMVRIYDCNTVYVDCGNLRGVKFDKSGNYTSKVIHRGRAVVVRRRNDKLSPGISEGVATSSKSSDSSHSNVHAELGQSSLFQGVPPDFIFGSPPVIPSPPFQLREDSSSSETRSRHPSTPLHRISSGSSSKNTVLVAPPADLPLPTSSQSQSSTPPRKRGKRPVIIETTPMQENDATSRQCGPKPPASTTLSGPDFQPSPINPFAMGLYPDFLSAILQPFAGGIHNAPQHNDTSSEWNDLSSQRNIHPSQYPAEPPLATSSSRDPLDTNMKRLEHHLDSALASALTIHTSGISSSDEILSPRAHRSLRALNALVSVEMPVSSQRITLNDRPTPSRFNSVKRVARWLRIP